METLLQIVATTCLGYLCLLALGQMAKVFVTYNVPVWRGVLQMAACVGIPAGVVLMAIWGPR